MHRLGLFLFSPILGLISIFNQSDLKVIRYGLWVFTAIYCFNIDVTLIEPFDIYRYVENVEEIYNSVNVFDASIEFLRDENNLDFVSPLITVISVYLGFGTGRMFLLLGGLLFGYFYSYNVIKIYSHFSKTKLNYVIVILFIIIVSIVPLNSFNGYRFWTASHIFFYAILPYLLEGKRPKFPIFILCLFTHFAFALPIIIFLISYFSRKILSSKIIFIVLSFFYLFSQSGSANTNIKFTKSDAQDLLPSFVYNRIQYYVKNDEKKEETSKSTKNKSVRRVSNAVQLNSYLFYPRKVESFVLNSMVILSLLFTIWYKTKLDYSILNIVLLFLVFALFLKSQSSGARYMSVAFFLGFVGYSTKVDFYNRISFFWNKSIQFLISLPILWYAIIKIRFISDFIGITGLFGNVFLKIFFPEEYRIIDFAKIFLPSL